jgi:uncharacterized protein YoxC
VEQNRNRTQELMKISKRLEETTYLLEQSERQIIGLKEEITTINRKYRGLEEDNRRK